MGVGDRRRRIGDLVCTGDEMSREVEDFGHFEGLLVKAWKMIRILAKHQHQRCPTVDILLIHHRMNHWHDENLVNLLMHQIRLVKEILTSHETGKYLPQHWCHFWYNLLQLSFVGLREDNLTPVLNWPVEVNRVAVDVDLVNFPSMGHVKGVNMLSHEPNEHGMNISQVVRL